VEYFFPERKQPSELVGLDEPIGREDGYPANSSLIEELEYPFGVTRAPHYRLLRWPCSGFLIASFKEVPLFECLVATSNRGICHWEICSSHRHKRTRKLE
jgi:hypothetical protein